MLIYVTAGGTFFYAYGVFLPVMAEDLGWSRSVMSGGLTISLLVFGLASPLIGISITRYGPRRNIILGNLVASIGLFATSQCHEIWHLYLFFGVFVGLGTAFGQYLACVSLINNWFSKKKGLAIGLLIACGGLAGLFFPPLASWLIEIVGWRVSWLIFGGISISMAVIVGGIIIVRDKPAEPVIYHSVEPGGKPSIEQITPETNDKTTVRFNIREIITPPTFWFIMAIASVNLFAFGAINAHQVAYLTDIGFPAIIAAAMYSLISVMSALGRFGMGALTIRFNIKRLMIIGFLLQICSLIVLLSAKASGSIYVYAILFGISCGAIWVSIPMLVAECFGSARFAFVLSWILPISIAAESLGPVVTGVIYDFTTEYTLAFLTLLILSVLGFVCTLLLRSTRSES
jgi:MFS family permease